MELITVVSDKENTCRSSAAAHNHVGSEVQLDLDHGKLVIIVKEPLGAGRWHIAGDLEMIPDAGNGTDYSITLRPNRRAMIKGYGFGVVKLVHALPHDTDYASIEVKVRIRHKDDKSWHPNVIDVDVASLPSETHPAEEALASLITMARQHASGENVLSADDLAKAILACAGK